MRKLQSPVDLMKYKLAMKLFFGPSILTRLIDVEYDFKNQELLKRVKVFKENLRGTEKRLKDKGLNYLPLNKIANSIQF